MQYLKEYQGFSVDLVDLSKVLNLIGKGQLSNQELLEETGFGVNKVRGLKEYLSDFGLLGQKNTLTELGTVVYANDVRFRDPITKWIVLYHWSLKESNPFMNFLVNDFHSGNDDATMIRKFKQWGDRNQVKTDYEGTKLNGLINRTKSACEDPQAFQALNLFVNTEGILQRSEPYNVHPYLVAYIFYYNKKGRTSIGFSELLEERDNISRFFNWNSKELDRRIEELMYLNLAKMIQHADLHLIEYSYNGPILNLISKYYEEH